VYSLQSSCFYSVAWGSDGNLYVSGFQYGNTKFTYGDITIIKDNQRYYASLVKYSESGSVIWANVVDGSDDSRFYDITVAGNSLYAAGHITEKGVFSFGSGITASADYISFSSLIVRYDLEGKAEWARTVNGGNGKSNFKAVLADDGGNVFTAGYQDKFKYSDTVSAKSDTDANNLVVVKYE